MRMRHWKKVIGLLLALLLAVMAVPLGALAAGDEEGGQIVTLDLGDKSLFSGEKAALMGTVPEDVIVKDGITRGEWMQNLVLLFDMGIEEEEYPDIYFPDISADTEYFDAIMTAVKYGVVDIEAGDDFLPEAALSRDFAAHTLNFCLGMEQAAEDYTYEDAADTAHPDDAQTALEQGWFELADGCFLPEREVTAEEITAMLNSVQSILDGQEIEEAVSDFKFAEYVKLVPEDADITTDFDLASDEVWVTVSGWDCQLAPGDTFAFYAENFAFVYGVAEAECADGVWTILTEDAPDDAVLDFSFAGELNPELTPELPEVNESLLLKDTEGNPVWIGPLEIEYEETRGAEDEVSLMGEGNASFSLSRKIEYAGVTGKLQGKADKLKLESQFVGKQRYFKLSGTLDVSCSVEINLLSDKDVEIDLGVVKVGPFAKLGFVLKLDMKAKISYKYSADFVIGLDLTNGNRDIITEFKSKGTSMTAEGRVSAELAFTAKIEFGKIGKAEASLMAGPVFKAKQIVYPTGTPTKCVSINGYLHAGWKFKVSLKLFVDVTFEYKYDYYNEKNSPIRVADHREDGVSVKECTRDKDTSGTADEGYTTPKYTTPSDSPYYSSGSPNGSSIGWTAGGDPVVIWDTEELDDGTLKITGYHGKATFLTIPETIDGVTVTEIGKDVFKGNKTIKSISISNTVTSVGDFAFANCENLDNVTFGSCITTISECAFKDTNIATATLPEGLLTLEGDAFRNCDSLVSVYIPSTLEKCTNYWNGSGPFNDCDNLDTIIFGEGIPAIPEHTFQHCNGLTNIVIPDTVTLIGDSAFANCENLDNVTFGSCITTISESAFKDTNIATATLPEGLLTLEGDAFRNCDSLVSVYIPSTLEKCTNYWNGSGPFNDCDNLDTVVFGEGIPSIPAHLFNCCVGLKHVDIPDSVTMISGSAFNNSGLESITIPDTVTSYGGAFLQNCKSLKTATLSNSVLTIPKGMFSGCSSMESFTVPLGVTSIPDDAFNGCSALKTLTVPDTVTSLGGSAFKGCAALTDLSWLPWSIASIGNSAFENCTGLTDATLPDETDTVGDSAFMGCSGLLSFTASEKLESFGSSCFENCTKLERVTLRGDLLEIPSYAFAGCRTLTEMVIPKGVTTIKNNAFYQDVKLYDFTIPETVTDIGSNAFSYPAKTTVRGVAGSYAETFAAWKEFIDITKHAEGISLASGKDSMTISYWDWFCPTFILSPEDCTDTIVSLESTDTDIVSTEDGMYLYGEGIGSTEVTAKTSGGLEYTFTVTVDSLTGIEITKLPDKTEFNVGDKKDLTGLVVSLVFSNGDREQTFGYDVTGFSTAAIGDKTVTVTRGSYTAEFTISVVRMLTGTLGSSDELTWTYSTKSGQLTLTGPVSEQEPVFAAVYDEKGRMLRVFTVTASGGQADVGGDFDRMKLIWVDAKQIPKCVNKEINGADLR